MDLYTPLRPVNIAHCLSQLIDAARSDMFCKPADLNKVARLVDRIELPPDLFISEKICPYLDRNPYEWGYAYDDTITVVLKNVEMNRVNITEYGISSPVLRGNWFARVEDIKVSFAAGNTTIRFRPTKHFSVLVKGGDSIDPLSLFYLSLLMLKAGNIPLFKSLCSMAAEGGDPNAQYFFGRYAYNIRDYATAVYWLAHQVLDFANEDCTSDLAYVLWRIDTKYRNPVLAENLLCELCRSRSPNAFRELGEMYLRGCRPVPKNRVKAERLLGIAMTEFGSREAEQLLREPSEEDESFSIGDVGIVAGVAAVGFFILKKVLFKKWW